MEDNVSIHKKTIQIEIRPEEIVEAVKKMSKEEQEDFLEELLAATSSEYLESIKEAREDYKAGRTYSHNEVFNP